MNAAVVVFGFAVEPGLAPVAGAAPYDVLARQLPRLLVAALNGATDRGARFFPFLGNDQGRRCFLRLPELLPLPTLAGLHKQGGSPLLVDGRLQQDRLCLRVADGDTLRPRFQGELPFDPLRPCELLPRLQFEVMGALGWEGRPGPVPASSGEALAWLLVARDELLTLEANLLGSVASDPLRALQRIAQLAPTDGEAQVLAIDLGVHLVRHGIGRAEVARAVAAMAGAAGPAIPFLLRAADLLQACGDLADAATLLHRVVMAEPKRSDAAERAAGLLFRQDRLAEARAMLLHVRAAGAATAALLAQLAAVADRQGDRALRSELCTELELLADVPPAVARLLITFLLEADRGADAVAIADRALRGDARNAALWLDRARALLLLDRADEADRSLQQARDIGLPPHLRPEVDRLQVLCRSKGLVPSLQLVEAAMRAGRNGEAAAAARALVRRSPSVAETWLLLGVLHHRLEHPRRAERALRKALQLREDLAEAHNRLGILLVGRGRLEEGHGHLARAIALMPSEPSPRLHMAQACALLGRRADGERELGEAARLGADAGMLSAVRAGFFGAAS